MNRVHLYIVLLMLMGLVFILPSASAAFPEGSLLAYYSGDTDSALWIDGTANGYDGSTYSSVFQTECKLSNCYNVSGGNLIGTSDGVLPDVKGTDISMCTWNYLISGASSDQLMYNRHAPGPTGAKQISLGEFTTDNDVGFYDGTGWKTWTGADLSAVTGWTFLCFVFDEPQNKAHLYVNGVHFKAVSYTNGLNLSGNITFNQASPNNGLVDDTAFWNSNLTQANITALWNGGSGLSYKSIRKLEITATDFYSSSAINTFNVTFTNGSFFTTTTGNITLINWTNGNYTATIRSPSYVTNTTTFEHINISSLNFNLFPNNAVSFMFKDEITNLPVLNVTYQFHSNDTGYSRNGSTTNGTVQFPSLGNGVYTLSYSNPEYRIRRFFIYIPLASTSLYNNTLYMLNETTGDSYLPIVVDENDIPYPGVFQALRWYGNGDGTGEYRVVESSQVDAQGLAAMFLEFNTASYIFRAINIRTNSIDTQFNVPKQLFEASEIYRVIFQTGFFTTYEGLGTLKGTNIIYYNTTTEYYEYSFADKPSAITNICMQMTVVEGVNQSVTRTCGYADSGVLIIGFNHTTNPGLYDVLVFANATNGVRYTLTSRQDNFISRDAYPSAPLYRNIALLAAFFIAITGAFVATATPIVGIFIMVGSIGLMGSAVLNMLPFGGAFLVSMILVGFMIAVITKK